MKNNRQCTLVVVVYLCNLYLSVEKNHFLCNWRENELYKWWCNYECVWNCLELFGAVWNCLESVWGEIFMLTGLYVCVFSRSFLFNIFLVKMCLTLFRFFCCCLGLWLGRYSLAGWQNYMTVIIHNKYIITSLAGVWGWWWWWWWYWMDWTNGTILFFEKIKF